MSDRPPVAMVFAAGRGERMRALSRVLPKPALPLPGGPVVGSAVQLAAGHRITSLAANTWHLAPLMEAALAGLRAEGLEIGVSREPELLGTGGGLARARDLGLLGSQGPVLVINGDGVLSLDLEPLFARHAASDDLVTLALLPHLDPRRWSRVTVDGRGRVSGILPSGDPSAAEVPLLYPGVMVVSREALDSVPSAIGGVAEMLWAPAREADRLGAVVVGGNWREVGTPEDYLDAALAQLGEGLWIDPSALVDSRASILRSLVGRGAIIHAEAVVERSIVAEGAVVHQSARVVGSVLLGAVTVGPGMKIDGAVLAEV